MSYRRMNDQLILDGTANINAAINVIRQLQADVIRKDAEIARLKEQLAAFEHGPSHQSNNHHNQSQQQQQQHQQQHPESMQTSGQ